MSLDKIKQNISNVLIGQEHAIDLLMVGLIANGHVLLEDVPGTGKTTLAKTLAKSIHAARNKEFINQLGKTTSFFVTKKIT